MTESVAYHSKSKEKCMRDLDYEKYEVIVILHERTSSIENDEYKLVDVKDYQDWYNNYIEKHIDKYHMPLNNKVNLESKNKSDTIRLRNAAIDKEITINKFNEIHLNDKRKMSYREKTLFLESYHTNI